MSLPNLLVPSPPLKWLYVDFNSYFASVEQQLNPALRHKPIAVVPVDNGSSCAIAASYEAKAYGVKTGTLIRDARKLCPQLICVLARHDVYVDFHHRAIAEIDRHIPVTAVCSIDEVACQLLSNEADAKAARAIALAIKAGLREHVGAYLRCSIGIAANRFLAKVATDIDKPDGLTILMPREARAQLTRLELRDIPGIGANMERRLHAAGVRTMAGLLALDRREMRSIWGGILGERFWYLLRGHDLPEIATDRRSIGHSHILAPDLRPPDEAIHVARRLTLKACSRMRRMGYCARRFSLSVRLEDGRRLGGERRCRTAQDSVTFLDLLLALWGEQVGVARRAGAIRIKKVSVVLDDLVSVDAVQPDLFDALPDAGPAAAGGGAAPRDGERMLRLSRALDRINHRFGRDSALIGMVPSAGKGFSGTKIAFTRIPDREEFLE